MGILHRRILYRTMLIILTLLALLGLLAACNETKSEKLVIFSESMVDTNWLDRSFVLSSFVGHEPEELIIRNLMIEWNDDSLLQLSLTMEPRRSRILYQVSYTPSGETTIILNKRSKAADQQEVQHSYSNVARNKGGVSLLELFSTIEQHKNELFTGKDLLILHQSFGNISYTNVTGLKDRAYKLNEDSFTPFGEGESLIIRGRNVIFNLNEKIIILDQLSDVVY